MKADLSRNTFRPNQHYRDVVKQQGRVDLDADWNEQQAINGRRVETEAVDVIGQSGAPEHAAGFTITLDDTKRSLRIGPGRYYVDGVLCENEVAVDYLLQPDRRDATAVELELRNSGATTGIVYLDVWLRHISALDDPLIRETALGGPDTTTRTRVVWQVKVLPITSQSPTPEQLQRDLATKLRRQGELLFAIAVAGAPGGGGPSQISAALIELGAVERDIAALEALLAAGPLSCQSVIPEWQALTAPSIATLNARTSPAPPSTDLCQLPPSAGYQRLENQLYRVEVHHDGSVEKDATFKWSRDNGSVVTAIESVSGNDIIVASTGPDQALGFADSQWVEITDDGKELAGVPGTLIQIETVQASNRSLTMKTPPPAVDPLLHPKLRRWDQSGMTATAGGVAISGDWQPLEAGIEVMFSKGALLQTADYWLIPARTSTGDIEWPRSDDPDGLPIPQLRRGIQHHFARLALVESSDGRLSVTADCRKEFPPLTEVNAAAPAMHVTGINWSNDDIRELDRFLTDGLRIALDSSPDPASIGNSTMMVTMETPFGDANVPIDIPMILNGDVKGENSTITWNAPQELASRLTETVRTGSRLRIRVTLKGFAISAEFGDRRLHLDGEALGKPGNAADPAGSPRIDLTFPSGTGVQASDFESWFFLVPTPPPPPILKSLTLVPTRLPVSGGISNGTVILEEPAPSGGVVVQLKSSSSRATLSVNAIPVAAGQSVGQFQVSAGQSPGVPDVVTITASIATSGSSKTKTLSLDGLA